MQWLDRQKQTATKKTEETPSISQNHVFFFSIEPMRPDHRTFCSVTMNERGSRSECQFSHNLYEPNVIHSLRAYVPSRRHITYAPSRSTLKCGDFVIEALFHTPRQLHAKQCQRNSLVATK